MGLKGLFGGGAKDNKKLDEPNLALAMMIKNVKEGKIEETLDIFKVGDRYKNRIMGLPSILRAPMGKYARKFFANTELKVGNAKMISDTECVVPVAGTTFDGMKLSEDASDLLDEKGESMGLFNGGNKIKMLPQALSMVDELIKGMEYGPVKGNVTLIKEDGKWTIKSRDEMTYVLCRATASEMTPIVKDKIAELRNK